MNVEKLYETLSFLDHLDKSLGIQQKLDAINASLTELVATPAHPTHQASLATALAAFAAATAQITPRVSPSRRALISEVGAAQFFDDHLDETVKNEIAANAMTPSVARDFVVRLARDRSSFLTTVRATLQGLTTLGISIDPLQPGAAEMAFLIPRSLFENRLGVFAKELKFIDRLISHFNEAIKGDATDVELRRLSSSDPTITIMASASVLLIIGEVVNKFLEAWKKIEEIREIRHRLVSLGLKSKGNVAELTQEITSIVEETAEESTELVMKMYSGETGRKNELRNAIRTDTLKLYAQIERGLTIEIQASPATVEDGTEADKSTLHSLSDLGHSLQFPKVTGQPLLLTDGTILDETPLVTLNVSTKKVTSKKTSSKTVTSKASHEDKADT